MVIQPAKAATTGIRLEMADIEIDFPELQITIGETNEEGQ